MGGRWTFGGGYRWLIRAIEAEAAEAFQVCSRASSICCQPPPQRCTVSGQHSKLPAPWSSGIQTLQTPIAPIKSGITRWRTSIASACYDMAPYPRLCACHQQSPKEGTTCPSQDTVDNHRLSDATERCAGLLPLCCAIRHVATEHVTEHLKSDMIDHNESLKVSNVRWQESRIIDLSLPPSKNDGQHQLAYPPIVSGFSGF